MKKNDVSGRRNLLKAAGAGLVAAAVPSATRAEDGETERTPHAPKPVYLWGCGWNRDLAGVFGEVCLTFEMRAQLNGTGVGTFRDDVHPEVNSQWRVDRASRQGSTYVFEGEVISSQDARLVGLPVKIVAKKTGHGTGSAQITVGTPESLVVIAIIAVLIGLLLPAVQ